MQDTNILHWWAYHLHAPMTTILFYWKLEAAALLKYSFIVNLLNMHAAILPVAMCLREFAVWDGQIKFLSALLYKENNELMNK